jgi:predicted GIY-YIG superfamily endonuclease
MYLVYLFKEKRTGKIIYVGSSSRPAARLKEHRAQLMGHKRANNIHKYMNENNLELYVDVEVIWVDCADDRKTMLELEEKYYFQYVDTIKNDRPGENRFGDYNPKRRKVRCSNDGKVFKTVTECARYYGKGRTTINGVLAKSKPYTWINGEKYYFEYANNV